MCLEKGSKRLFLDSLPIAIGYSFVGLTFGMAFSEKGGSVLGSVVIALTTFSGATQLLALKFLEEDFIDYIALFSAVFLVSIRHIFYGISSFQDLRGLRFKNIYLIGTLTDENFGMLQLLKKQNLTRQSTIFKTFLLNHFYWIFGCGLGTYLGKGFYIEGIEFSLTALFIIFSIESLQETKGNHELV